MRSSADEQHCADGSSSEVWGTGRNDFGQLGDGTVAHRETPTKASWVSECQHFPGQRPLNLNASGL